MREFFWTRVLLLGYHTILLYSFAVCCSVSGVWAEITGAICCMSLCTEKRRKGQWAETKHVMMRGFPLCTIFRLLSNYRGGVIFCWLLGCTSVGPARSLGATTVTHEQVNMNIHRERKGVVSERRQFISVPPPPPFFVSKLFVFVSGGSLAAKLKRINSAWKNWFLGWYLFFLSRVSQNQDSCSGVSTFVISLVFFVVAFSLCV